MRALSDDDRMMLSCSLDDVAALLDVDGLIGVGLVYVTTDGQTTMTAVGMDVVVLGAATLLCTRIQVHQNRAQDKREAAAKEIEHE